MIEKSSIDRALDTADIVEVIGQFLNLKRRGVNYLALCPFHDEKTPSFNVNPARGIFKCFGCGKGGDVVTFLEEYEKFTFVEAVRWLADFYQIELEETEDTQEYQEQHQIEESLRVINEFATSYFHALMNNNKEGKIVGKGYFLERGFSENIIKKFRLGYCLDEWDNFTKAAIDNGFDKKLLEKSGLVKIKNDKAYDNYKGRVIFPIFSRTGKVLGFGARILKNNDKAPKYINTPENELYVKNRVLYGLYQSRQAIRKKDECFLVEGYTDVIALHQGGIENVVASSGTSLTKGQLKLLSNLTKNLTILYDGDAAGIKAALRGLGMALEQSFRVRLVLLPEGEDPDSFMQDNGKDAFADYIGEHRQDIISFHLETGLKEAGNDPIKKSKLVKDIAETISKVNKTEDFTLQSHYIKESAEKLDIEEEGLTQLVNKFIREKAKTYRREQLQQERQKKQPAEPDVDGTAAKLTGQKEEEPEDQDAKALLTVQNKEEWQLLKVLLSYGEKPFEEDKTVAEYFFETIDTDILKDSLAKKVVEDYRNYWEENGQLPGEAFFLKHEDRKIRHKAVDLFYEQYTPNPSWEERFKIEVPHGENIYKEEVNSTFSYFELKFLRRNIAKNTEEIKNCQDADRAEILMKTHIALKKRERDLMTIVILK